MLKLLTNTIRTLQGEKRANICCTFLLNKFTAPARLITINKQ